MIPRYLLTLISISSFAGLTGAGYGISTFFGNQEKSNLDKNEKRNIIWEILSTGEGNKPGEKLNICERKEEGLEELIRGECDTEWVKEQIKNNNKKNGIWMKGEESEVIKKLEEWKLIKSSEDEESIKIQNRWVTEQGEICEKMQLEEKNIQISCVQV